MSAAHQDSEPRRPAQNSASKVRYTERLKPSFGMYAAALLIVGMVFLATIYLGKVASVVAPIIAAGGLLWWLRSASHELVITTAELRIHRAIVPRELIQSVEVYRGEEARKARGPWVQNGSYLAIRGWVDPVVVLHLAEHDQPVPTWVVSTRNPEKVAAALRDDH